MKHNVAHTHPRRLQNTACFSPSRGDAKAAAQETEFFVASAVHDIRGHLQLIASGISLLRRNYEKLIDAKGEHILVSMSGAVVRMNQLIADILELSKAKKECHQLELVDLNELVHLVVTDLEPDIETNHATVSIGHLPVVCGDKAQLYHVFQNLLNNSLKYRKPSVAPAITISSQILSKEESCIPHSCHEIALEDNGIGFTNEQAKTIFGAFHRLKNPGIEGSGLGLSICHRVVTGHRGCIRAEGTPGVGAKFIIQLPSIESCKKSDACPFAATSYDKKCPALVARNLAALDSQ